MYINIQQPWQFETVYLEQPELCVLSKRTNSLRTQLTVDVNMIIEPASLSNDINRLLSCLKVHLKSLDFLLPIFCVCELH